MLRNFAFAATGAGSTSLTGEKTSPLSVTTVLLAAARRHNLVGKRFLRRLGKVWTRRLVDACHLFLAKTRAIWEEMALAMTKTAESEKQFCYSPQLINLLTKSRHVAIYFPVRSKEMRNKPKVTAKKLTSIQKALHDAPRLIQEGHALRRQLSERLDPITRITEKDLRFRLQ